MTGEMDLATIPPARRLEGLGSQLRTIFRSHVVDADLAIGRGCGCELCVFAARLLRVLRRPATREAVDYLMREAREYRQALWYVFSIAVHPCGPAFEADRTAYLSGCQRSVDTLGVPLASQVYAMTLNAFTAQRGCPFCAVGACAAQEDRS